MHIGILDDDIDFSTILKQKLIARGKNKYKIYNQQSQEIYNEDFDIFFLDVMLDDTKSFIFGEELLVKKPNTILVYISNLEHFVYDSIYQKSFFFIRKSNLDNDLDKFFKKYNKRILELNKKIDIVSKSHKYTLFQKEIIFIESMKNSIKIHTSDQEYIVYKTLTHIFGLLDQKTFYKLNSYTIVNMEHVKTVGTIDFVLENDEKIKFTKGSRLPFVDAYVLYRKSKVWQD